MESHQTALKWGCLLVRTHDFLVCKSASNIVFLIFLPYWGGQFLTTVKRKGETRWESCKGKESCTTPAFLKPTKSWGCFPLHEGKSGMFNQEPKTQGTIEFQTPWRIKTSCLFLFSLFHSLHPQDCEAENTNRVFVIKAHTHIGRPTKKQETVCPKSQETRSTAKCRDVRDVCNGMDPCIFYFFRPLRCLSQFMLILINSYTGQRQISHAGTRKFTRNFFFAIWP